MNYKIKEVHISTIKAGDTVEHEGIVKTVSNSNIKRGFMGITIFGDSYNSGSLMVKKVIILTPKRGVDYLVV